MDEQLGKMEKHSKLVNPTQVRELMEHPVFVGALKVLFRLPFLFACIEIIESVAYIAAFITLQNI